MLLVYLYCKVGAFAVLYTVPSTVVVACWFYEALYGPGWRLAAALAPCSPEPAADWDCRLAESAAPVAVGALRVLGSLAAGATPFVWVCSRKTLGSWRRRLCRSAHKTPVSRDRSRDLCARRAAASRDVRLAAVYTPRRDDVTAHCTT